MHFLGMTGIGLVVGLLIGMTGMGSGSLLTPALILICGMPPAEAVGTSLAFSFATKCYGSWQFYRRGMVRMNIVQDLSLGGLPGVLLGVFLIRYLSVRQPEIMNAILLRAIGVVLIFVAIIMFLRLIPLFSVLPRLLPSSGRLSRGLITAIGFSVGLSVVVTSIGSGSALIPVMVLLYRLDTGTLVGTNLFFGAVLAAMGGVSQAALGNVAWGGVAGLLCGSIPAVWVSCRFLDCVPRTIHQGIIAAALMATGAHILSF